VQVINCKHSWLFSSCDCTKCCSYQHKWLLEV